MINRIRAAVSSPWLAGPASIVVIPVLLAVLTACSPVTPAPAAVAPTGPRESEPPLALAATDLAAHANVTGIPSVARPVPGS